MIVNNMINAVQPILAKIHAHPFNQELADGSLSGDKFIFYLMQDGLYLSEFSRALALTAARLPNTHHVHQFIQFALGAIQAERDLHMNYMKDYQAKTGIKINHPAEQSPACFMYANYILKMASLATVEEAVSCLLPCFFIYNEVGKKMATTQQPNNPYSDWIALYSSESFEDSVNEAIHITNELALNLSVHQQEKMIAAFGRATQLELMFWEGAYSMETWLSHAH